MIGRRTGHIRNASVFRNVGHCPESEFYWATTEEYEWIGADVDETMRREASAPSIKVRGYFR